MDGKLRALVFASSNIFTFCAGADIKEFTKMSPDAEGRELVESAHEFMRGMESSSTVTIAAVNSIAFGGGCELAMACDFRIAAESATFGQPEINLGIIPGFGGTQRLPRLVGESKALEMNLVGDPIDAYEAYRVGLANQVVPDHELLDTALLVGAASWPARRRSPSRQIKKVSHRPDLDDGLAVEGAAFGEVFGSEDAKEGIGAFLGQAEAEVPGEVTTAVGAARLADLLVESSQRRGPDRGRDLRAVGDPRLPHARHRALGERGSDGGRAHRRLARATRTGSGSSTGSASRRWWTSGRTPPTWRSSRWRSAACCAA